MAAPPLSLRAQKPSAWPREARDCTEARRMANDSRVDKAHRSTTRHLPLRRQLCRKAPEKVLAFAVDGSVTVQHSAMHYCVNYSHLKHLMWLSAPLYEICGGCQESSCIEVIPEWKTWKSACMCEACQEWQMHLIRPLCRNMQLTHSTLFPTRFWIFDSLQPVHPSSRVRLVVACRLVYDFFHPAWLGTILELQGFTQELAVFA